MSVVTLVKYHERPKASKPLVTFLTQIQHGTYCYKVERLRDMYHRGVEKHFDEEKRRIPYFSVAANYKVKGSKKELISYSGFVVLEIPYLNERDKASVKELLQQNDYVFAFFDNVLKLGLCIIVKTTASVEHHAKAFKQIRKYFMDLTGVQRFSKNGKDLFHTVQFSFDKKMYLNLMALHFAFRK